MKKKSFVVAMLIGIIAFVSCEDDYEQVNTQKEFATKETAVSPANPENKYDSIGVIHNNLLEKCKLQIQSFYQKNGDITLSQSHEIARSILHGAKYDTNNFSYGSLTMLVSDSAQVYRTFISSSSLSSVAKQEMLSLVSTIVNLAKQDVEDYGLYKSAIVSKEREVSNNSAIPSHDRVILLSSMSVLRYSLCYWADVEDYFTDNSAKSKDKKMPKWVRIVAMGVADAAGAIGGAAAGAPTVLGAVAGGVVGAVSASSGAATLCDKIDKVIDDGSQNNGGNNGGNTGNNGNN